MCLWLILTLYHAEYIFAVSSHLFALDNTTLFYTHTSHTHARQKWVPEDFVALSEWRIRDASSVYVAHLRRFVESKLRINRNNRLPIIQACRTSEHRKTPGFRPQSLSGCNCVKLGLNTTN